MIKGLRFAYWLGFGLLLVACEPVTQSPARNHMPQRNGFGQPIGGGMNQMSAVADIPQTQPPEVFAESAMVVDINRGRVLKVRSIMDAKGKGGAVEIDHDLALEDAMQRMKDTPANPATVVRDGKPVGALDMRTLIDAIERPAPETASGTVYR